jgi:hypothetical protein
MNFFALHLLQPFFKFNGKLVRNFCIKCADLNSSHQNRHQGHQPLQNRASVSGRDKQQLLAAGQAQAYIIANASGERSCSFLILNVKKSLDADRLTPFDGG